MHALRNILISLPGFTQDEPHLIPTLRIPPSNHDFCRFLGGDGTEDMTIYRVSGNLYTVSFDSNLGDVIVRARLATATHETMTIHFSLSSCGFFRGDLVDARDTERISLRSIDTLSRSHTLSPSRLPDPLFSQKSGFGWGRRLPEWRGRQCGNLPHRNSQRRPPFQARSFRCADGGPVLHTPCGIQLARVRRVR